MLLFEAPNVPTEKTFASAELSGDSLAAPRCRVCPTAFGALPRPTP